MLPSLFTLSCSIYLMVSLPQDDLKLLKVDFKYQIIINRLRSDCRRFFKLSKWLLSLSVLLISSRAPFAQSCSTSFVYLFQELSISSSISVLHSALCENVKMILFCFFGHEMWFPDRDLGWSSMHIFPAFTSLTEKPVALHLRAFFLIREKTYRLSQKCQSWWSWEQSLIHW